MTNPSTATVRTATIGAALLDRLQLLAGLRRNVELGRDRGGGGAEFLSGPLDVGRDVVATYRPGAGFGTRSVS